MAAAFEGRLAFQNKGESIMRFAIIAPVTVSHRRLRNDNHRTKRVDLRGNSWLPGSKLRTEKRQREWYVSSTPGTVTVQRAYGDMTVTCEKGEFRSNPMAVASATKAMAFGNILVGGLIGAAVDAGTGSAYRLPCVEGVCASCPAVRLGCGRSWFHSIRRL
jgi:hypothetical protein